MKTQYELKNEILSMDRKGYPRLKSLKGDWNFSDFTLQINHVQGDPFASPSNLSVTVPQTFPEDCFSLSHRKTALEDFLLRHFSSSLKTYSFKAKGSGKSGLLSVTEPGPEILKRTALEVTQKNIVVRFTAGFPARGRSINGMELVKMLTDYIPAVIAQTLFYKTADKHALLDAVNLSDDQTSLRQQVRESGLVAFVSDGSILPRESGISKKPLKNAVAFSSPESLKYTFSLPHKGKISGMGIKKGITLIVGGGYHGKSTLLQALEMGIYNHTKRDGRSFVVTDETAFKLRAEDGRSIYKTDISLFINNLPNKKDTHAFSSPDASGSTSQAAGVIESCEAGSHLLLIDEDTSATNFMVRDSLMQEIVSKDKEPITPFTLRAKDLFNQLSMSTVLVAGSSGAYFSIADTIIQMDTYTPVDITETVKNHVKNFPGADQTSEGFQLPSLKRYLPALKESHNRKDNKVRTDGTDSFSIGRASCELRFVSQIPDSETVNALAFLVKYALTHLSDKTVLEMGIILEKELNKYGFTRLTKDVPGNFCYPRRQEICAALSRIRCIHP